MCSDEDRISSCSISIRGMESRRSSSRHYDPSPIHENLLEQIIENEKNGCRTDTKSKRDEVDHVDPDDVDERTPLSEAGRKKRGKDPLKAKTSKSTEDDKDSRPPRTCQAQQKCPKCRVRQRTTCYIVTASKYNPSFVSNLGFLWFVLNSRWAFFRVDLAVESYFTCVACLSLQRGLPF